MVPRMDEVLYWFETLSGKHPAKPIYSINFRWFGMDRDAEPWEIDAMSLVFILKAEFPYSRLVFMLIWITILKLHQKKF